VRDRPKSTTVPPKIVPVGPVNLDEHTDNHTTYHSSVKRSLRCHTAHTTDWHSVTVRTVYRTGEFLPDSAEHPATHVYSTHLLGPPCETRSS